MLRFRSRFTRAFVVLALLLVAAIGYGQLRAASSTVEAAQPAMAQAADYMLVGNIYGELLTRLDVMMGMQRQEPYLVQSEGWRAAVDALWLVVRQTNTRLPDEAPASDLATQHAAWLATIEHLGNAEASYGEALQQRNPRMMEGVRTELEQASDAVDRLKRGK